MKSHRRAGKSPISDRTPDIRSWPDSPPVNNRNDLSRRPQRRNSMARRPAGLKKRGRNWPLPLVIACDVLLVGIGLVIFALFHHVLPRDVGLSGRILPQPSSTSLESRMAQSSDALNAGDRLDVRVTNQGTSVTNPGMTGNPGTATSPATGSSSSNPGTSGTASPAQAGAFAAKFKDRFTSGAIERTVDSYRSAHVSVSVRKVETGKVAYTISDIYVSDVRYFRTAFASGKYARGVTDTVLDMARVNKAITAISGDYYGIRDRGIVIRNGVLYRDVLYKDILIMNNDGSMQTFTAGSFNIDTVLKQGAWQGWSFGPMLLTDGQPMTTFNSDVTVANPRGAIGYYEPGHYCFVLVDGRQPGYSDGMTMKALSQLFHDLGCKVAYNLDGGQSAVLTFLDAVANSPYKGGREISDIVYIADN